MKGTRRGVLQQLEDWLHDEQGEPILWLHGAAGTGKSAIAQTFAEICFADGILGASFFCSQARDNRRDHIREIFPTLAFQLAHRYPRFREELLKLLRTNPDVGREFPNPQMEKLIVGPLEVTQIQTLIIIDGLDKCFNTRLFLSSLLAHIDGIPNVKFFITGRPMPPMEPRLGSGPPAKVLRLHEVDRSSVDADVKLCLRVWLRDYAKKVQRTNPPEDWPSSHWIDELFHLARGRFSDAGMFAYQIGHTMPPSLDLVAIIQGLTPPNRPERVVGILPIMYH